MNIPLTEDSIIKLREDFPILKEKINGKPLVYFDNASTTQKPQAVIQAVTDFYTKNCANIHRGIHTLSERATDLFEQARMKMQKHINAASTKEIIFVRGVTEGINLVAQSFVVPRLKENDEILISYMEHHSNIVPWQLICQQTGAKLKVAPLNEAGEINLEAYRALITERTQFISIMHVSNALGTINPIKEMIALAHQYEIPVLIDGAQAAPHLAIDVQELDCDFYCISGHKMFAPVGIGVLYGKEALLENMAPYHGGGEMIAKVSFEETLYNILPYKFEAGTPNIAGVIGLGAALDYINEIGIENLHAYEQALLQYATEKLNEIPGLRIIGTARNKVGVLSFTLDKIHAHDIGTILDTEGVAIRSGHHCAMPLMENFNLSATARASLAFYNTRSEVDALIAAIHKVKKVFG